MCPGVQGLSMEKKWERCWEGVNIVVKMQQSKKIGVVWFTTNLRITDNLALYEACKDCDRYRCYVFNPKHYHNSFKDIKKTDVFRSKFIIETVQNLSKVLIK